MFHSKARRIAILISTYIIVLISLINSHNKITSHQEYVHINNTKKTSLIKTNNDNTCIIDTTEAKHFFSDFQSKLMHGDRDWIIKRLYLPIAVRNLLLFKFSCTCDMSIQNDSMTKYMHALITSKSATKDYEHIFTKELTQCIISSSSDQIEFMTAEDKSYARIMLFPNRCGIKTHCTASYSLDLYIIKKKNALYLYFSSIAGGIGSDYHYCQD